jgi:hypothetical protein
MNRQAVALSRLYVLSPLHAGSIDIMSTPEDVAEQQRRLKPGVVVAQYLFDRVRLACRASALQPSCDQKA